MILIWFLKNVEWKSLENFQAVNEKRNKSYVRNILIEIESDLHVTFGQSFINLCWAEIEQFQYENGIRFMVMVRSIGAFSDGISDVLE